MPSIPTPAFPGAVATDQNLAVATNRLQTTLAAAMSATDTILTLTSSTGVVVNSLLTIDAEIVQVTALSPLTVTRAFDATIAAAHAVRAGVFGYVDAWHHNSVAAEIKAIETALGVNLGNVAAGANLLSANFNFAAQTPGGSLVIGSNSITMTPVPRGVNGTDVAHYLYISGGTGTAEACLITGGTGTSGQTSGTIIITCANTHSGAWTIASASGGIKEAAIVAPTATIALPASGLNIRATLVLPTTVSIIGQGIASTILTAATAASPAIAVADGLGTATGQGMGVHSGYQLTGPGTGVGLWIGGDPSNGFAPSAWTGSYTRFNNLYIQNFGTTMEMRKGNFVTVTNCFFEALTNALYIPSDTGGEQQPFEFTNSVLSVPSGNAVRMDASGFTSSPVHFTGGQVSGAISGAAVDWDSQGTHYEPNATNAGIVDISASGLHRVTITGGMVSMHGTALTSAFNMNNASTGSYFLTLKDVWVQSDSGMTVTNLVNYAAAGGSLALANIDIAPAGTFTNLYTLGGSLPILTIRLNSLNAAAIVAAASTLAFPAGNYPVRGVVSITGSTLGGSGVTAVSGLLAGQSGTLATASAQTFTAGTTVGNTITTIAGLPYTYFFDGTKIWIK
jgi:hypothetical protein